jgi:hypothetical protein
MSDYEKELHHRLLTRGISEEWIGRIFDRHDVGRSLQNAHNMGLASYEEELEVLVEMAEDDYHHYVLESPGHVQEGDIPPRTTPKKGGQGRKPKDVAEARERQDALGQYLAGAVSGYETINNFRKHVLSGRVLSEKEALTFLSSPLAAAKSRADFKTPRANLLNQILDTDYQAKEGEDDSGPYRRLVWGSGHIYTVRPLVVAGTHLVFPGDAVTNHDSRLPLLGDRAVILPHPREKGRFVVAQPGSIIGDALRLAEVSLNGFPISKDMGVWFILTGEFNPEHPVRIRYETIQRPYLLSRTTITLEVESWLPPEEILEQYRHAQQQILGGTPRSLKRRTVDLFKFVIQHREKKYWSEVFDAWNKAHPSQRFKDRSHLYTTYMRAREKIASPRPL